MLGIFFWEKKTSPRKHVIYSELQQTKVLLKRTEREK